MEHILPWSLRGVTEASNLALAWQGCNSYKQDRTSDLDPRTGLEEPLFHPRQMRWGEHFAWSPDGLRVVGMSAAGRATLALLRLNRPGLVALRALLVAAGQHPPSGG